VAGSLKIVFVMIHVGLVRNFESTVRALVERGHRVELTFMHKKELGPHTQPLLEELCATGRVTVAWLPDTRDFWRVLATSGRLTQDFLRYLKPEFRNATKLRRRAAERVPVLLRAVLGAPVVRSRPVSEFLAALLRRVEMAIPVNRPIAEYLRRREVDLLLVTPLVDLGSTQTDWVKAARAIGVRTMLPVASWDNLTNKGNIRVVPDLVAVWNPHQRREAIELHGVPGEQVVVTGAQAYDHWFEWKPARSRQMFSRMVGLDPDRSYVFYVGSSGFIAGDEAEFVRSWVRNIRSSPDQAIRDLGILIRPHPQNVRSWERFDDREFDNVVVWPRAEINPLLAAAKRDYFDSFYYCSVVVGINTSALIEAVIIGKPVLTLLHDQFTETQEGTLHFHYLINPEYGFLRVARTFEEHLGQLSEAVRSGGASEERRRRFIEAFVRPHGIDAPGTPRLASSIEGLGSRPAMAPRPRSMRWDVFACCLAPAALVANAVHDLRGWSSRFLGSRAGKGLLRPRAWARR
jgi:hypothetical protein